MSQIPPRLTPIAQLWSRFSAPQQIAAPPMPAAAAPAGAELTRPDRLFASATSATAAQTELSFVPRPLIGPEDRVLHIGDSHTVGIYGQEMDKHLRSTGAKVETYGSAGSSPSWWKTGQSTRSGFFSRDADGTTVQPKNWRDPHPTPKFKDLLGRFQPNVIMISLGANLINASSETIENQVREMAQAAKASGARLIWVGPPDGRESKKPTSKQNQLYEHLERVAREYGDFIDSRPLTEYPASGGDGVHYWGPEGSRRARQWSQDVFDQVQALPR
ncbi:MAG: hypothetical protein IGS03_02265 [Candidatus Sericytochromatia bacterium]|nr:hypothetical protein [Candidatus Sericytochromatia bacterium]